MFDTESKLTPEREDEIAHLIAERVIADHFRFMPEGEYRRRLGEMVSRLKGGVRPEELHQFLLEKLPKLLGSTFGWDQCGITGSKK